MTPGLLTTDAASSQHDDETVSRAAYAVSAQELAAAYEELEALQQEIAVRDRRIVALYIEQGRQLALGEILQNCIDDRTISAEVRSRRIRVISKYARHILGEVGE
ncbi:MAG TPA: hypothetical protein VLA19_22875 [Herpetosiphonaceae bacterium]|nr:hypothetical protein [Herpetosiphonaceae bacterium]